MPAPRAWLLAPGSRTVIHAYLRDDAAEIVSTDVFSFHVDSAPAPADTRLCTYHGPSSQLLRNDEAVRKIDIPGNPRGPPQHMAAKTTPILSNIPR